MAELKRTLNFAEVTFFAVGVILGAGIYTIIGEAAGFGGNMLWLSFLIASVTALMTAFSYAELVSLFPKAGGEFVYLQNAMGINIALVVVALATGSLSLAGDIKTIGLITNFFVFNTFLFVNAPVIYMRIKNKEAKRPFRIPGKINNLPVISILAMLMTLLLAVYTIYGLWST